MNISGNTILVTGGGTGIGLGLAQAFQQAGNEVIIAGRRADVLKSAVAANPGMQSVVLDVGDAGDIARVSKDLMARFPRLNVVVNNAGVMRPENMKEPGDAAIAEGIITTNLLGPIRLTAALMPLLLKQPGGAILTVSSGLAFLPLAMTPTYCATKAAIHSYSQSLRWQLKETKIQVIELIPPYVQTTLMGAKQVEDPRAMPLKDYISETMQILRTQPEVTEVCVERVKFLRYSAEAGKYAELYKQFNEHMPAPTD